MLVYLRGASAPAERLIPHDEQDHQSGGHRRRPRIRRLRRGWWDVGANELNEIQLTQSRTRKRDQITDDATGFLRAHGFAISPIATNHTGEGHGFRIEHAGRSVVYLTDNELAPPYPKTTEFDEFARFCQRTDVLIHDAQYVERDMPHKHGWGHSLVSQVCELAVAAEVKHLVLFHHDPERTDSEVRALEEDARSRVRAHDGKIECTAAHEGLVLAV